MDAIRTVPRTGHDGRLLPVWCYKGLRAACLCGLLLGAAPLQAAEPLSVVAGTKSRGYIDGALGSVSPYKDKARWRTFKTVAKLYDRVWTQNGGARVLSVTRTNSFPGHPYLMLQDRDGDAQADFYVYMRSATNQNTQEFGGVFDLDRNNQPDWIVFYGGVSISEKGTFSMTSWNHHGIDRNGDGKVDVLVIDGVDRNGNGRIEPGATAWIYDDDFDGRVDRGEHILNGKVKAMPRSGNRLDWQTLVYRSARERPAIGKKMPLSKLFGIIQADLARHR